MRDTLMRRSLVHALLVIVLAACADKPTTSSQAARSVADTAKPNAAPPPKTCTPGADQTCNDDPAMSSLHGACNPDGTCTCGAGFERNPQTSRCK
jgi:hypothetical protein